MLNEVAVYDFGINKVITKQENKSIEIQAQVIKKGIVGPDYKEISISPVPLVFAVHDKDMNVLYKQEILVIKELQFYTLNYTCQELDSIKKVIINPDMIYIDNNTKNNSRSTKEASFTNFYTDLIILILILLSKILE